MSTRCNIHFNGWGRTVANIYRHSDGYPEGVLPDLQSFFEAVETQTRDTRFDDAGYLAAKFVVWQANQFQRGQPLNFLSLGVCIEDHTDIEYVYEVNCEEHEENGRPIVTHRSLYGSEVA